MLKNRFPILNDTDFKIEDVQNESMMYKLSVKLKKGRSMNCFLLNYRLINSSPPNTGVS